MNTQTAIIPRINFQKKLRSYGVLTLLLFLATIGYGYYQFTKYNEALQAYTDEQNTVAQMTVSNKSTSDSYQTLKAAFQNDFGTIKNQISAVYPNQDDYTTLTRQFDDYFTNANTAANPVFLSDLKYGEARVEPGKEYAILPVTMTLQTTRDNFDKFLQYVETSGALSTDGKRLMDISSISINFPVDNSSVQTPAQPGVTLKPQELNVTISLNAYFQKPADTKTNNKQ